MQVINSVSELPDWFREASYARNLDGRDWYREIWKRVWVRATIELSPQSPTPAPNGGRNLFNICHKSIKRNWYAYYQNSTDSPIRNMSKGEAIFLSAFNWDQTTQEFFDDTRFLIDSYKEEITPEKLVASHQYADLLEDFTVKWDDYNELGLNDMAVKAAKDAGNPFLGFSRFYEGYPLMIDTSFDDDTILKSMKSWLAEIRATEEPKARRPFNQNDFDDWTLYKIRELHDLDLWSSLYNVRIPDRVIAAALWPHPSDDFSPVDVLRTTARKKMKQVLSYDVSLRLYGQMMMLHGENFLPK